MGRNGHGFEELSEFAMEFIKQAGKKALPFYGKGQARVKFDQGMVTEADLRIADYFQENVIFGYLTPSRGWRTIRAGSPSGGCP